jgi:folylpolyglutamate synthase/dihydrofolate synthase
VDYLAALDRLYKLEPQGICLGLERVRLAAVELDCLKPAAKCVQIAGTNGKGTVAFLVAHTAHSVGLSVGLFTSPHLHRFTERIRINGEECDSELLGRQLGRVLGLREKRPDLSLTFFEVATLAALGAFAESKVELIVLEVGLGGRLDATSIVEPAISVVTSVGYDHTDLLGNTLTEIAREKAAICRSGAYLVIGTLEEEAFESVADVARQKGALLRVLGKDFECGEFESYRPGKHQKENAAVAHEIYRLLGKDDSRFVDEGFRSSLGTAFWPGRFETIEYESRHFIVDVAHNMEATRALIDALECERTKLGAMIFGALKGKPAFESLSLLRHQTEHVVLVAPPISRALDPKLLASSNDRVAGSIEEALDLAIDLTGLDDTILVTGSLFTVSAVRAILLNEISDPLVGL